MVLDKGNQGGKRLVPGVRCGGSAGILEVGNMFGTETVGVSRASSAVDIAAGEDSLRVR